ncbi:hypothetical protein CEUSTIGMA_g8601.t1 [Chlamydomonas eustigma]|uniref:RING-type domain-containing protein n=1 Tax=Chlamydomonas eustigma TaxID=1157962 RepID=A0A250XDK7_9CHLO|nr:hypothetical protein CEUSTIGMA_g8601.t1 [Chlamydomonas eustigma]|eukprot:GAX81168.1 hypothetical protein CEUSTIGMA_g8601.t1 [Chlamydomonas eustigma]
MFSCFFGDKGIWNSNPRVPEQYTKPSGLYGGEDKLDLKKLKRCIQEGKLAPCFPGCEEPAFTDEYKVLVLPIVRKLLKARGQQSSQERLEECPICMMHYPLMNTSTCCGKRVCTECFLQVQMAAPSHELPSCPFCKVRNFSAKFVGAKSEADILQDKLEEQWVIEARIREREEEVRRDAERAAQRALEAEQRAAAPPPTLPAQGPQPTATFTATTAGLPSPDPLRMNHLSTGRSPDFQLSRDMPTSTLSPSSTLNGTAGTAIMSSLASSMSRSTALSAVGTASLVALMASSGGMTEQTAAATAAVLSSTHRGASGQVGSGGSGRRERRSSSSFNQPPQHDQSPLQQRRTSAAPAGAGNRNRNHRSTAATAGRRATRDRSFRIVDYVPSGIVDMSGNVDDINDLMLEQALYESLAAAGSLPDELNPLEPLPQQRTAVVAATGNWNHSSSPLAQSTAQQRISLAYLPTSSPRPQPTEAPQMSTPVATATGTTVAAFPAAAAAAVAAPSSIPSEATTMGMPSVPLNASDVVQVPQCEGLEGTPATKLLLGGNSVGLEDINLVPTELMAPSSLPCLPHGAVGEAGALELPPSLGAVQLQHAASDTPHQQQQQQDLLLIAMEGLAAPGIDKQKRPEVKEATAVSSTTLQSQVSLIDFNDEAPHVPSLVLLTPDAEGLAWPGYQGLGTSISAPPPDLGVSFSPSGTAIAALSSLSASEPPITGASGTQVKDSALEGGFNVTCSASTTANAAWNPFSASLTSPAEPLTSFQSPSQSPNPQGLQLLTSQFQSGRPPLLSLEDPVAVSPTAAAAADAAALERGGLSPKSPANVTAAAAIESRSPTASTAPVVGAASPSRDLAWSPSGGTEPFIQPSDPSPDGLIPPLPPAGIEEKRVSPRKLPSMRPSRPAPPPPQQLALQISPALSPMPLSSTTEVEPAPPCPVSPSAIATTISSTSAEYQQHRSDHALPLGEATLSTQPSSNSLTGTSQQASGSLDLIKLPATQSGATFVEQGAVVNSVEELRSVEELCYNPLGSFHELRQGAEGWGGNPLFDGSSRGTSFSICDVAGMREEDMRKLLHADDLSGYRVEEDDLSGYRVEEVASGTASGVCESSGMCGSARGLTDAITQGSGAGVKVLTVHSEDVFGSPLLLSPASTVPASETVETIEPPFAPPLPPPPPLLPPLSPPPPFPESPSSSSQSNPSSKAPAAAYVENPDGTMCVMLRQVSRASMAHGVGADFSTAASYASINDSHGRVQVFNEDLPAVPAVPEYDLPQYDLPENEYNYDLPQYDLPLSEVGTETSSQVSPEAERLLRAIAETDARVAAEIAAEDESLRRHLLAEHNS